MADHIKTRKASGIWSVRAGGAVLAESKNAIELSEGDAPTIIYFPREDIAMDFLERTDHSTTSAHMGEASYFSIVTKSTVLKDAAWSYEAPKPGLEAIAGHLAFYASDKVAVEAL